MNLEYSQLPGFVLFVKYFNNFKNRCKLLFYLDFEKSKIESNMKRIFNIIKRIVSKKYKQIKKEKLNKHEF